MFSGGLCTCNCIGLLVYFQFQNIPLNVFLLMVIWNFIDIFLPDFIAELVAYVLYIFEFLYF